MLTISADTPGGETTIRRTTAAGTLVRTGGTSTDGWFGRSTASIGFCTNQSTPESGTGRVSSNLKSQTIVSETYGLLTLSTGINKPVTTIFSDGETTASEPSNLTIDTTTSLMTQNGFKFRVTMFVVASKAVDCGSVILYDLWTFFSCLRWNVFNVLGWKIDLPSKINPP